MKSLFALAMMAPLLALASSEIIIRPGPGGDAVRERATREARQVRADLVKLAAETARVSVQAKANGNEVRARRFQAVSVRARNLANDVQREVIRPLRTGERLATVGRNLDRLMPELADLGRTVQAIQQLPRQIDELVARVVLGVRRLQSLL